MSITNRISQHVLIVDDEESICWGLRRLMHDEGYEASVAASAEEAVEAIGRRAPDLVILDVRLPGMDGLTAMKRFQELAGPVPIVVITAFGNLETAVTAVRNGAFDYLPKPFDLDRAAGIVRRALSHAPQRTDHLAPSEDSSRTEEELIGTGPAMQEVFKRIALVASTDASVLITGESGTGKELVARAIHRHSRRADKPLLPVHLASLSPTLVESELFGHVRGAFTGADTSRSGILEMANGGTVFFDEASDIPSSVQVKLLRVLEQYEVIPVGDTQPRVTSFRVIAATSSDLRDALADDFRQDLYYRLAVFEITLPPLRSRVEDIPLLAERFLRRANASAEQGSFFTDGALAELCRRPWPGNVRELRNAVEHAALLARGGPIAPEHLPPPLSVASGSRTDVETNLQAAVRSWATTQLADGASHDQLYQEFLAAAEPPLLDTVLNTTDRNRAAAAEVLGIHRATLRKKLSG